MNKNGKQLFLGALLGATLLASLPAPAADKTTDKPIDPGTGTKDSGFYVGGAVGQSKFHAFDKICGDIGTAGGTVSSCDDKSFAWKAYGGYQFIRYFGVEVGYADFGKAQAKVTSPGFGNVDYKTRAVFLEGVVTIPIINHFSFLGKLGVVRWNTKLNIDGSTGLGLPSQSDSGFSGMFGTGLQYMFTDAVGMRAEYEIYNSVGDSATTGGTHVHVMSLEGLVRF